MLKLWTCLFQRCVLGNNATVAYFREQKTGVFAYEMGKCREAPLMQPSKPLPELQEAMYGTLFEQLIVEQHDIEIERTFFWTDSTTVLQ